jgi:hypothetical protein
VIRILSILIVVLVILIGCPNGEPIDIGPIPGPAPDYIPQKCKVMWSEVSFDNYDALLSQLQTSLISSTCTANDILCISIEKGSSCDRVWVFTNMDSIPRHTLKDECGNYVIHYLEDDF